ncbi:MAG: hypothetical protein AUJ92_05990 [Armatimonadetes bacterium CG2_30_59_28]|nr:MAG: hypothetical protein AUJ92_05990 [Armatimonadetes bacterium CG2_30_59_28]
MKQTKRIVVEVERCLGCRSCELACAVAHSQSKVLERAIFETPRPRPRIFVEGAANFAIPLQCRHCETAPCMEICPTHAVTRRGEQGPVVIEHERCIGCEYCVLVCPFGVMRMDEDRGVTLKCDLCYERLERGQQPACVEACLTHALEFRDADAIATETRRRAAQAVVLSMEDRQASRQDSL